MKIKTACLIFVWSLLLYSCKEVSFREPQPVGVPALKEVPKALQGRYVGIDEDGKETDTVIVESWGYHIKDTDDNDWLGRGVISDSLVIKYFEDYCFVNFRSGDQWVLRVIKQKPSGDIQFLSINVSDDKKRKDILKKLNKKKLTVKEIERKDDTYYQINPTKEQLVQLLKEGFFTGGDLSRMK
ncbi:MAG: hypothetical protein HOP08_09505 [Cyclobacteriaceae bacterium]|nr:hypothetical protein [Cyclobacteriaceae bacterium]